MGVCNVFATGSSNRLYFGKYPRFINTKSIKLGRNAKFGLFARVECHAAASTTEPVITVGDHSSFGDYVHVGAVHGVHIGNYVLGGSNILIIDHSHGSPSKDMAEKTSIPPRHRELSSKGAITIGDNVWIGDNVTILSGTTVGEGSILSVGSIVKRDVPPYTLYFGD